MAKRWFIPLWVLSILAPTAVVSVTVRYKDGSVQEERVQVDCVCNMLKEPPKWQF